MADNMNNKDSDKNKSQPSSEKIGVDGDVADSFIVTGSGNTFILGNKKDPQKSSRRKTLPKKPKKINPLIVVAWIGLFATVLAALIGLFGDVVEKLPLNGTAGYTAVEIFTPSATPTNTATPITPTWTPTETPTETPSPVPTQTPIPPVPLGEDWIKGCVSTLWVAHPSSVQPIDRGDGCWREPISAFSAEYGDLDFLAERQNGQGEEIFGLFALLPESGTVTFTVRLRDLNNADLWMGVFSEPNVNSQGLLMTILNGDVKKRSIIQKDPSNYVTIQGSKALDQGYGYSISFVFEPLYVRSMVNPSVFVTSSFPLRTEQKWLFLGFKGLRGSYRIEGTFLNFELNP
jgi:hypothetical protein